MNWAVIDLETTTRTSRNRKGNPFDPENWVVMAGWASSDDNEPHGERYTKENQEPFYDRMIYLLDTYRVIVGVNHKFDLSYALRDPEVMRAWHNWVARGGIFWDLQLVEYLLDGQEIASHMLSLDDLALRYGMDTKVDEVKVLWDAGVSTEDIDPDLLTRYLLGETLPSGVRREGDIGNTMGVFLQQLDRVREEGMSKFVIAECGALACTVEMEFHGLHVDMAKAMVILEELRQELAEVQGVLDGYVPDDFPLEFSWSNRYHTSPLIFGGHVKYKRREYKLLDGSTTVHAPDSPDALNPEAYDYPMMTIREEVLGDDGEPIRYKSGKKMGEITYRNRKVPDYANPKTRMEEVLYTFPGFVEPEEEWASATEGLYSVAAEVIETLTANTDIPFLQALGQVTKLNKDIGTYFMNAEGTKGMLTLVGDDWIVHHRLNHTSTRTGRLSSSDPNSQNIPKGDKSRVKEIFTSRFPGGRIVSSDFSAMEVYVQANMSGATALLKELAKGTDLHCLRLAWGKDMSYEEVYDLCKVQEVPEWDKLRDGIKAFTYGRSYGAGVSGLVKLSGMPEEAIRELIENEKKQFPEIEDFNEAVAQETVESAIVTNKFVAHPLNPALRVQLHVGYWVAPTGKKYSFRSAPSGALGLRRGVLDEFSSTQMKNAPIQGEGATICKLALWILHKELAKRNSFDGNVLVITQIHDAIYLDAHPDYVDRAMVLLDAVMRAATRIYCNYFGLDWEVMIPAETHSGPSMAIEEAMTDSKLLEVSSRMKQLLINTY